MSAAVKDEGWNIVLHWTVGTGYPNQTDLDHYNLLIDAGGNVHEGRHNIEDQRSASDGDYAAHTRNFNTRSIGIALCGMMDAVEAPFDHGPNPINAKQIDAAWKLMAKLCKQYGIPVTRKRVLTHAEVQPTLGIEQRGKWDITWLPGMTKPGDAVSVGDVLRKGLREEMGIAAVASEDALVIEPDPVWLKRGDKGTRVKEMQELLASVGYFSGRADGDFGPRTEVALVGFQKVNGLSADGIYGPKTRNVLMRANPQPARDVSLSDLRASGSQTIKGASAIDVTAGLAGVATTVDMLSDVTGKASGLLPTITMAVREHWPALIVLAALGVVLLFSDKIKVARLRDAQTGANVKR